MSDRATVRAPRLFEESQAGYLGADVLRDVCDGDHRHRVELRRMLRVGPRGHLFFLGPRSSGGDASPDE